jgi:hypothetical protein
VHVENVRSQKSKQEYNLYDDVHEREKEPLISPDRLGFGQLKEYKVSAFQLLFEILFATINFVLNF